jgi:hypothetical protein
MMAGDSARTARKLVLVVIPALLAIAGLSILLLIPYHLSMIGMSDPLAL